MTTPLKNLQNEAKKIQLTESERAYMRSQLLKVVRRSQQQAYTQPVRSTYSFTSFFFSSRFAGVSMAALLIVALGGTTTYAAQGSLPGSPLYPVKIYVNEGVQQALAVSDEAKISFHASAAEERLREAEALASQGKLDASVTTQLETNFVAHVERAHTIAATLDTKDPATAVEARAMLDSSLTVHSNILARIGDDSDNEQTKENSNSIAQNARTRGEGAVIAVAFKAAPMEPQAMTMALSVANQADDTSSTSDQASGTESTLAAKTSVAAGTTSLVEETNQIQKKTVLQLQKRATARLEAAEKLFKNNKKSLSASTTKSVEIQLADLIQQLDFGKDQIKDEDYVSAQATFTMVLKQSIELAAYVEASKTYKRDFLHWDDRAWDTDEQDSLIESEGTKEEKSSGINIQIGL